MIFIIKSKPTKMKTALQELIERLEEFKAEQLDPGQPCDRMQQLTVEICIQHATELLEKEREQIEKACAYGFKDALKPSGSQVLNWKQYYNETFKQ
jgi:hypothetical protein